MKSGGVTGKINSNKRVYFGPVASPVRFALYNIATVLVLFSVFDATLKTILGALQ